VGLARAAGRGDGVDRLENEALPFHERVRYAFLDLAAAEPGRYLVLDAGRPAEAVASLVADRVATMLPPPPARPTTPPATNGGPPHEEPDPPADPPTHRLATVDSRPTVPGKHR
jgi:dTMP kinase